MNPEIKKRWTDALRSGKYEQGSSRLNLKDEQYCCLGVLCELAVEDNIVTKDFSNEITGVIKYIENDARGESGTALPPSVVWQWADLESISVEIEGRYHRSLTEINDSMVGYNFDKIADLIDEQF